MPNSDHTEPDVNNTLSRRDVLKGVSAAGVIGAFGTGPTTATPSGRLIVGTHPRQANVARRRADHVFDTLDFDDIGQAVVGRWPEEALQGLEHNPNIKYIEKDGAVVPLDHEGNENPDEVLSWADDRIDVGATHANSHMGNGINVAIIDSGIDSQHDDLKDNLHDTLHLAPSKCSGSCPEDWHDDSGHGTAVAGIVGAVHTDSNVIGVAPEVTLHAVKVIDRVETDDYTSRLAKGIEWTADNGIDVANMSLRLLEGPNECVEDAMKYARNNDVVLVVASGNNGNDEDEVVYPAAYAEAFAVGGVTELDELADYSSTGPEVDIAAPTGPDDNQPGRKVLTTKLDGGTRGFDGTSAAAPHVAGAAALLLADGTTDDNVESDLEDTAEDLGLDAEKQGAGLVDIAHSLGLDSVNDLLAVETDFVDPTSSSTEATLNGELTHLIGSDSAEVFFEYRKEGTNSWTKTPTETLTGTVSFDSAKSFDRTISGLDGGEFYEFRAGVTVEDSGEGWSSTEHGDVLTFEAGTNLAPTASFMHDPTVPDPDEDVEFDATGSTNPEGDLTYEWDFEDDGSFDDNGKIVTHSYATPGNVTVRLRVTDEIGQTDETTESFRVNASPEAAFTYSPQPPNEDETVTFDASDSSDSDGSIVTYEWDWDKVIDFDPDESTTNPTTTHTFSAGGDETVALRVTDNNGASDTTIKTVSVNRRPVARIDYSPTEPNEGEQVQFDASNSFDFNGSVEKYEWDWDYDGSTFDPDESTTDPKTTHTFTEGGDKTVALRVTDDKGATSDFKGFGWSEEFYVNHAPTPAFSHTPTEPNEGEPVSFDASATSDQDGSIATYEWDFDDDGSFDDATGVNPSHTFSDSGDKTVTLRVTDDNGASRTTTKSIHVNAFPTAAFTHKPDIPNEDELVEFDAKASTDLDGSIATYEWDFGDGTTATTTDPVIEHTYAIGDYGERNVTFTVTDDDDATDEVVQTIRINAVPEADFNYSPALPNEDEPVEFDASASADRGPDGGAIATYEWDFDDGTTATTTDPVIEHTYDIGDYGEHDVTLRVTDNDGATHDGLSVQEETIRVNAVPEADFEVVTTPPVRNEPVEFDASASADRDPEFGGEIVEYEWDFGDGTTATTTDPAIEHTYTTGGQQTVTLHVTDNDGASHEALSVHEETLPVYIRVAVDIMPDSEPNSVNPNQRGEIPVAVLHTSAFDSPSRLDSSSVHFGDPEDVGFDTSTDPLTPEGGATPAHNGGHVEDVDGDGNLDSMLHFPAQDADFESDDDEGKLIGLTTDTDPIPVFGTDTVNIVGGGGP